jgi:DNA-binding transcriptional MocR family regulator
MPEMVWTTMDAPWQKWPMQARANRRHVDQVGPVATLVGELGDWATGSGPLFRQLSRTIASCIERGVLERGSRLPPERTLAAALLVARGTVVAAYDLLVADGLIERRRGSGTYVAGEGVLGLPPGREGSALVHRLVDRSAGPSEMIDLSISVLHDPSRMPPVSLSTREFAAIEPDTGLSPWGISELRSAVAAHVTTWGLPTSADEVVITTGAQQAISASAACWLRPGDTVVVDDPTYPGAVAAFSQAGAKLRPVPVDSGGARVEELARALAEGPSLVYLQPTVHSPTGALMREARRRAIARLIQEWRVPLVEDMALADLAWLPAPPPIAAHCTDASVAVVGSLSKVFWGGLRIGWVRAPRSLATRFARVKATHDLGSSAVSQLLGERLLRLLEQDQDRGSGYLTDLCSELRHRYDVLANTLHEHLPSWRWETPSGGLSIWVRLPEANAEAVAQAGLRHGVAVATASALSTSGAHPDRLRLSFSAPPAELEEGVRRLAAAHRQLEPTR